MTSLEQHLADHAQSTRYVDGAPHCACKCGAWMADADDRRPTQAHRAHVADAWRESRTVRTVEELDALPNGSIYVSDAEGLAEQKAGDVWFAARCRQPFEPVLPGVVVHRPDEDGAQ